MLISIEIPFDVPDFDLLTENPGQSIIESSDGGYDDRLVEYKLISKYVEDSFMKITLCPFCGTSLEGAGSDIENQGTGEEDDTMRSAFVWSCPWCRYWQIYWYTELPPDPMGGMHPESIHQYAISKIRTFENYLPDAVNEEIAQVLRRHKKDWYLMSPKKFEILLASIIRANFAECEVFHVGGPDDGGYDVYFFDAAGHQWLVQAKRREKPEHTEGVSTIRNLLGAMFLNQSPCGIVASTADHFSYRAQQAAKKAGIIGKEIRLFDLGKLQRMLEPFLPDRPWLELIKAVDSESARILSDKIPSSAQGRLPFWEKHLKG